MKQTPSKYVCSLTNFQWKCSSKKKELEKYSQNIVSWKSEGSLCFKNLGMHNYA